MQLLTVTSENTNLWCWCFLAQIASSKNLTFRKHLDLRRGPMPSSTKVRGTARPLSEGRGDRTWGLLPLVMLANIGGFNAHCLWQLADFVSWSWSSKPWSNSKLFEIPNQRTDCVDSKKSKQTITFKNEVLGKNSDNLFAHLPRLRG